MPRYAGTAVFILIAALATAGWWLPSSEAQAQTLLNLNHFDHTGLDTTWSAPPKTNAAQPVALTLTATDFSLQGLTISATAAPDQVDGGEAVTLDGTVTDGDDTTLTYSWSANPTVGTFGNAAALDTTWTAPPKTNAVQAVTLTLSVNDGLTTTTTTASVTVRANQAPAFAHTEVTLTILEGQGDGIPVASPVTAVDPDGDELTYTLGAADASSFEVANNGQITVGPGVFLVQSIQGRYTVTLTATDDNGATDSTTVTIPVVARGAGLEPPHQPPVPTSLSAFICIGDFPGCPDTFVFLLPTLLVGYMAVQKKRQQLKRVEVMGGVWVVCFLVLAIGTQIPVLRIIAYFMAAVAVGLVYMGVRR